MFFGFYDYKFEVVGLILYVKYFEERFGVGLYIIFVLRIRFVEGVEVIKERYFYLVFDEEFKKIVVIIWFVVFYIGMILFICERLGFREEVIDFGIL